MTANDMARSGRVHTWPPRARARLESMPPAKLALAGRHRWRRGWEGLAAAGRLGSRCGGARNDLQELPLNRLRAGAPETGCTASEAAARSWDMLHSAGSACG